MANTYVDLDAFRLDDGRVMVCLSEPGHRIPEEFVPFAKHEALLERVTVLERALERFAQMETGTGMVQVAHVNRLAQAALDG